MKYKVLFASLCVSTALCTVAPSAQGMKEEDIFDFREDKQTNLSTPQFNFTEHPEIKEQRLTKEKKPSPLMHLIPLPLTLDEGLKALQGNLTQKIAECKNSLKSLKKKLRHVIKKLEKGELQKNLEEFVSLLTLPEELILNSEKSDLAFTLGEYYFQNQKETETILIHPAFKALDQRIDRCEHFAGLLESHFNEASLALREIKTLYQEYKEKFLQFNPPTMKENYKHHLAPKAEFYGTLLSPSLIQQTLAYELVSRTLLDHLDKQNKEGTHAVRSFEGMHFKVYDYDSEMGLYPGKELAMYHLYQLLVGEGVAPSTLICLAELPFVDLEKAGIKKQVNQALLDGKNIGDIILETPQIEYKLESHKTKTLYPIQVSSTIEGIGLHTFLQNYFFAKWKMQNPQSDPQDYLLQDHGSNGFMLGFQKRFVCFIEPKSIKEKAQREIKEKKWTRFFKEFNSNDWSLEHIDEESFARMTLMSFLTDPGDSKADNFMLTKKNNNNGNSNKWHIVSIDTDRVLESNVQEIMRGTKAGHHKVHHKSLFYTLPAFMKDKSIPVAVRKQFASINAPLVLARWLLTLKEENKAYEILKEESSLSEKIYSKMKLPFTFKKGQISTLLNRLETLKNIFTHHDFNLTLDRTFQLMHPVLHAYYEKLQSQYPDDPLTMIYADNTRENNQELTVEEVLKKEGLNKKNEERKSFINILQEYNNSENSQTQEDIQTIEECLEELAQDLNQFKGNKTSLSLLDLVLEARDSDLFKRLIHAQGPQAVNASLARQFYQRTLKNSTDIDLQKAWDLLVNHLSNAKLHWYIGLENLFLSPEEVKTYQETQKKKVFKITGASEGDRYLPEEVWDQLINKKNEFKRQNQDGAHAVGKATRNGYTLYFKFLPKIPGLEEAVGRWTRNLIGFGAPHVELFRLDSYPLLVSQEIKGLTLKETIHKHPERLKQLDKKSLSQVFLTTMLTNPEDGKPDNIIVEPLVADQPVGEQISSHPLTYRLIGIDNDQAFVPAMAKEQKTGWSKPRSTPQVKSILYCFDEMDAPIDREVRENFKALDPHELLSTWLHELDLVHGRQVNLFTNQEDNNALLKTLFQEQDSYVGVPFKSGDLHDLYDRFLRLQQALHDPEVRTHHHLLMRVEPRLGKRYGNLRQDPKCPKNLYERFKTIDGHFFSQTMGTISSGKDTLGAKGISEKEVLEDIIKKDRHNTPKIALEELQRRATEVAKTEISILLNTQGGISEAFDSEEFRIKFFKELNFNYAKLDKEGKVYGPISLSAQRALLSRLERYAFHDLTLNNCHVFNAFFLQKFHIKDLTHATLIGCRGIDYQVPAYLSEQCSGLIYLNLSQSTNLAYVAGGAVISSPLSFPDLKKFIINQCPQLTQINIKADKLQSLEAKKNPKLTSLKVEAPSLLSADLKDNKKLENLASFAKGFPNLKVLNLIGCNNSPCKSVKLPLGDNVWNINGWGSNNSPSLAFDNSDKLYIAHTWVNNNMSIAVSEDGGISISNYHKLEGWATPHSPSIAFDTKNNLYIAYTGIDKNVRIASSKDGGDKFLNPYKIEGLKTNYAPSLATDKTGKLYIAYTGVDSTISVVSSKDGGNTFSNPYKIEDCKSNHAPSLAVDEKNNKLYIAHTAIMGSVSIASSEDEGNTFSNHYKIEGWKTHYAPSLAVDKAGKLYMAHVCSDLFNKRVGFALSEDGGKNFLNRHHRIEDWKTNYSPALAVDENGRVYMEHVQINGNIGVTKQIKLDMK